MGRRFLLFLLALLMMLLMTTVVASALDRRNNVRDIDGMRYNVLAERTYEGRVENKGRVVDGLVYFPLKTSDITMEVQIGPEEFINASGFRLRVGEMVTVFGVPVVWRGQQIVLAREVGAMSSVLIVRDRDGVALWDTLRPVRTDPEMLGLHWCELRP